MKEFIPIRVNPVFFFTAAIIGFINSFTFIGTIQWMGIIFISVLVHEYGHALTAKFFGQSPRIELVAFGGLTIPEGPKLKLWKEFIMIVMGPCFGFLLFILASILLQFPIKNLFVRDSLLYFRFVNLFWTFVNLLPILPLDGGQLVRVIFESFLGSRAWKVTLVISSVFAISLAILFFLWGLYIIGAFFLLFAFQNIESFRQMKNYSEADQLDDNQLRLKEVEALLASHRLDEASFELQALIEHTKSGMIHTLASEYLAKIRYDQSQYSSTYHILLPIEKRLSKEALCLLYFAAYDVKDYQKVADLSGRCFEERKTVDVAIRAAAANAQLHNNTGAIQWLKTVQSFGEHDLEALTHDSAFDSIRNDPAFIALLSKNR